MLIDDHTYIEIKEKSVSGRYVIHSQIIPFLENLNHDVTIETNGISVQKRPIQSIEIGNGQHRILMWSQMHGNESTTTKAVLDLINFLISDNSIGSEILKACTVKIIPMLNPDGAHAYTRVNANEIDLNRDAKDLSQPESKVLRKVYDEFQPDFCFNLHDQRTIFNVGNTDKPATVSFLAPSHDEERSISKSRAISMQLITAMNVELQQRIPGQVGRYDDAFNANCVGDTFQMLNTPTILFEAGHFYKDYDREKTRAYIFHSLAAALTCIANNEIDSHFVDSYFEIPENQKMFVDVLIRNVHLVNASLEKDIGIQFVEVLKEGSVLFEGKIEHIQHLENYYGHITYDCEIASELDTLKNSPFWNMIIP